MKYSVRNRQARTTVHAREEPRLETAFELPVDTPSPVELRIAACDRVQKRAYIEIVHAAIHRPRRRVAEHQREAAFMRASVHREGRRRERELGSLEEEGRVELL